MSTSLPALLIRGGRLPGSESPISILVEGGRIRALGRAADDAAPAPARHLDVDGSIVSPGFIDLQVNGAAGHDLTHDPDALPSVARALPRYGVTAFLPTIVSAPYAVHDAARAALSAHRADDDEPGATPLGLHIEGPFLSPERPGVHDRSVLKSPDRTAARDWSPATGVRMATLAPELPGATKLIADLVGRGVVVSAGHTAGTFADGVAAIEAGVRYATHLFNAMTPLGHREPGIAAALLVDERVAIGLIPDGLHVDPAMVALTWRIAGAGRLSAVTDAIAALGMPPGRYRLGHADVEVDDRSARVDGRLAGSVIGLDTAVRNLRAYTGAGTADAVASVTSVPARLLGLDDRGEIGEGAVADLTLLSPDLEVMATLVAGRVAYVGAGLSGWA